MVVDINGGVISSAFATVVTVGSLLVWIGHKILGRMDEMSREIKGTNSRIDELSKHQEALDTKLDKWGERLGTAQRHISVIKAMTGVKYQDEE